MNLLLDFSKSRQIVILTHSPYFISWEALFNGGQIARTWKRKYGIEIYQIQSETIKGIKSFENNFKNPHILGLNAREVFFLQDKILLTEGQEDVIYYGKIIDILNLKINGNFYGWGVGGANNMDKIIFLLKDLGFQKIGGRARCIPVEEQYAPPYVQ